MLKYFAAAFALKAFSCSDLTRRMYRTVGNSLCSRKRVLGRMPAYYLDRVTRMLRIAADFGVMKNGDRLIELGTGWLHWEAVTARLFFDVGLIPYDAI